MSTPVGRDSVRDEINDLKRRLRAVERRHGVDTSVPVSSTGGVFSGTGEATLADDTGVIQVGPSGAPNMGIDQDEIQARSGGAAATLYLNPLGGTVRTDGLFYNSGTNDANLADGTGLLQLGPSGSANIGIDQNEIQARSGSAASALYLQPGGGQTLISRGSAAAPGLGFFGDENSGFYSFDYFGQFVDMVINGQWRMRWGGADTNAIVYYGTGEVTAADYTGINQIGPAGGAQNIGIDGSEIQSRQNGVGAQLDLNAHGGIVNVGGKQVLDTDHTAHADPHPVYLLATEYSAPPNDSAAPAQITGLTLYPSFDNITAKWTASTEIDMVDGWGWYQVQVDTENTFANPTTLDLRSKSPAILLPSLAFGTLYYVRVRAIDANAQLGSWSATASTTTIAIDPDVIGVWALTASQYIRSADYNGTDYATGDATIGWNIDEDGIEAIDARIRGEIQVSRIEATVGTNICTNGTLDSVSTGWAASTGAFDRSTTVYRGGSGGSAHLNVDDGKLYGQITYTETDPNETGETGNYVCSVYVKGETTGNEVFFGNTSLVLPDNTGWHLMTMDMYVPVGADLVLWMGGFGVAADDEFWFDDLTIKPKGRLVGELTGDFRGPAPDGRSLSLPRGIVWRKTLGASKTVTTVNEVIYQDDAVKLDMTRRYRISAEFSAANVATAGGAFFLRLRHNAVNRASCDYESDGTGANNQQFPGGFANSFVPDTGSAAVVAFTGGRTAGTGNLNVQVGDAGTINLMIEDIGPA